jgi:hypothetical protein
MERQHIVSQVMGTSTPQVFGFDGRKHEVHGDVEQPSYVELSDSPAAIAFYLAARKAGGGCSCRDRFCDCQITV